MTEAYQSKLKAKARKAFDLLMGGMEPDKVVQECHFTDVSSMTWLLREKGFSVGELDVQGNVEDRPQDDAPAQDDSLSAQELAAMNEAAKAGLKKKKAKMSETKPDPEKAPTNDGFVIPASAFFAPEPPTVRFGTLALLAVKGNHFKLSITDPSPEDECPLPADHVQTEMLAGEFAEMVDDLVAGGVIPLTIAGKTFSKYADLLRWASEEMESAARVFEAWAQ